MHCLLYHNFQAFADVYGGQSCQKPKTDPGTIQLKTSFCQYPKISDQLS